jgi:hypothetical protein
MQTLTFGTGDLHDLPGGHPPPTKTLAQMLVALMTKEHAFSMSKEGCEG